MVALLPETVSECLAALPATPVLQTALPLPNRRSGKVRDLYDVELADGTSALLIVATDRVSAFDVVLDGGLPGKGVLLTQLSRFWFERTRHLIPNHLLSTDIDDVPGLSDADRAMLAGRIMLCQQAQVVPVECIARGYLAGSGFKDYLATGSVCGIDLPEGLRNGERLPEALFTPSTKAASGHDENITYAQATDQVGAPLMAELRAVTLALYAFAAAHAAARGLLIADTKFEFGRTAAGTLVLIDEALTPDSSRFWPADAWRPGGEQPSFDKQMLRDHLEAEVAAGRWNREPPGPALPASVMERSLARYAEAVVRLQADASAR